MKNLKIIFAFAVLMLLNTTLSAQKKYMEMVLPPPIPLVTAPIFYNTLYPYGEDTPSAADHVLKLRVRAVNEACTFYVNGENKGVALPGEEFDLYLPVAEYNIDAVTIDTPVRHFTDHFLLVDTGWSLSYYVYFPQKWELEHGGPQPERGYNNRAYQIVEHMPEFIDGEDSMNRFISHQLKYPDMERDNDIHGRVLVEFIVNADGSLSDVSAIRKVSPGLDREAVRVVKMLHFRPGLRHGKPVRVTYIIPISFRLI